jgi:hypothetical protein
MGINKSQRGFPGVMNGGPDNLNQNNQGMLNKSQNNGNGYGGNGLAPPSQFNGLAPLPQNNGFPSNNGLVPPNQNNGGLAPPPQQNNGFQPPQNNPNAQLS